MVQALLDVQRRFWDCNTPDESNYVHPVLLERAFVALLPPYLEFVSVVPIITVRFVNWDDMQLSEIATVFFYTVSLSFSFSQCGFALHISPDMVRRACKIQRAALQTSWILLCVYSNNFTLWLFTKQLQRCMWFWLKVFSMGKHTERSKIKSLCVVHWYDFTFFQLLLLKLFSLFCFRK